MALGEQLAQSDIPAVQRWAAHALEQITATPSPEETTLASPDQELAQSSEPGSRGVNSFSRTKVGRRVPGQPRPASELRSSGQTKGSQDLSNQILSALCHGSISMLASLLLFVLFQNSALATGLGLLRFGVPVAILYTAQDEVVKANAREATNYAITSLLLLLAIAVAVIFFSHYCHCGATYRSHFGRSPGGLFTGAVGLSPGGHGTLCQG
ncbi:MAG: DUF4870 domain-containing protein [Leptolyngbyaceae cyanobacterium SM2_3_12]|nr:DUF4870 domain-containing protein [Leptolyngbyaceae cyanobacterium SM2_3_12]